MTIVRAQQGRRRAGSARTWTGRSARLVLGALTLVLTAGASIAFVAARADGHSPAEDDFVAIDQVPRQTAAPPAGPDASTGALVSQCGLNEQGHHNADNVIASPRSPGAAQHTHEYVGNVSTDTFSTDDTLASAGTTCSNGDLSVYYWPVLRVLTGQDGEPAVHHAGPVPADHNPGTRVPPASVSVTFRGNPTSHVVAMPRFLRVVTGDSRAATAGGEAVGRAVELFGVHRPLHPALPALPERSAGGPDLRLPQLLGRTAHRQREAQGPRRIPRCQRVVCAQHLPGPAPALTGGLHRPTRTQLRH